jgi:hypothetical protein
MSLGGRVIRVAAQHRDRRRVLGAVLRTIGPALPRPTPPRLPIFIVGSPRSGTTLVYELLKLSPLVAGFDGESHVLWEIFHRRDAPGWRSDTLGANDVTERERRVLHWAVGRLSESRRYLDKAPANSFRIGYLDRLFPDASFVFVKRHGLAVVASLVDAWNGPSGLFPERPTSVPLSIQGYSGTGWKFVSPPGWEEFAAGRSLAEVCAFQWAASTEAILEAKEGVSPERWVEVRYEDLVSNPLGETADLLERLALPHDPAVVDYARELDHHVTKAVTPPDRGKWRRAHPDLAERIMPIIGPTVRKAGYELEGGSAAGG